MRGRVLAREQQGTDVGEDVVVRDIEPLDFLGRDDRLEEVRRGGVERRLGPHALAHLLDDLVDPLPESGQRAVEVTVLRQADVSPVRERRVHAPVEHREDLVQVLLNHRARGLHGVEIDAEGELGGDVDGQAHQVAAEIDRRSLVGRALPSPQETPGGDRELRKEGLEMRRVQRHHDDLALAQPFVALGREHSVQAHLRRHRLQPPRAPEARGPLAMHALHGIGVGHHRHA